MRNRASLLSLLNSNSNSNSNSSLKLSQTIHSLFKSCYSDAARKVFDQMPCETNEATWSSLISHLSQNGRPYDSLLSFREMRRKTSLKLASNTIKSVISSCIKLKNVSFGMQIHAFTLKISNFIQTDKFLATSFINMYGKCGYMQLSLKTFEYIQAKNIVAWSSIISNYLNNNEPKTAVNLFKKMIDSGLPPNEITLTTAITACTRIANLLYGKELHAYFLKSRVLKLDKYISTTLVNLYCKCNYINYSYRILYTNGQILGPYQTSMWNSILTYHVTNFRFTEAVNMIKLMGQSASNHNAHKVPLNEVTLAIILPICANFSEFLLGKELHCYAIKHELDKETIVGNGLLDLYCKSGKINWAQAQFNKMGQKSVVSYTTMINGYCLQGDGFGAIQLFEEMLRERNIVPDRVTFVALISACSHSGLVKKGVEYFEMMMWRYKIIPVEENYGSLVDLLARAGYINEARNVIKMMHVEPGENVWGAFLGGCRIYGVVSGAELSGEHLFGKEIDESGFNTLLSNVYAELGRLERVSELQRKREELGFVRRGSSWLESSKP